MFHQSSNDAGKWQLSFFPGKSNNNFSFTNHLIFSDYLDKYANVANISYYNKAKTMSAAANSEDKVKDDDCVSPEKVAKQNAAVSDYKSEKEEALAKFISDLDKEREQLKGWEDKIESLEEEGSAKFERIKKERSAAAWVYHKKDQEMGAVTQCINVLKGRREHIAKSRKIKKETVEKLSKKLGGGEDGMTMKYDVGALLYLVVDRTLHQVKVLDSALAAEDKGVYYVTFMFHRQKDQWVNEDALVILPDD